MKLLLIPVIWALTVVASSAHKFTARKVIRQELYNRESSASFISNRQTTVNIRSHGVNISSIYDLIYLANITVGGVSACSTFSPCSSQLLNTLTDYSVQLDTGSSDLFIKGATYPISNAKATSLMLNLTYAIGWAYGHVTFAPVQFLGISVSSQALIDASSANNPALSYGADGVFGIGFTRLSMIDSLLNSTKQSTGGNLLYNLFLDNPSEPNFIAISLQRSTDNIDDVQGTFSIGEYEPQFANVSNSPQISTWPVNSPHRWNVLIDAVIVNNTITVPSSSVKGAPSNKAVALIDTGSSYTYVSKEVSDALYSKIPGAMFDTSSGFWVLPCDAEVDVALQIGGQVYPLHPLDVNPSLAADPSKCVGSFVPQSVPIDIDFLIGDNVLRSVYSVYDFGEFDASGNMGNPHMKFLSLVDPDKASAEFHQLRGGTPNTNITYTGLSGAALTLSSSLSDESLGMITKFVPPMLALVAFNSLVLIICCIVWLVSFIRKRRVRAIPRLPRSRNSMPMNDTNSYIAGEDPTPSSSTRLHAYEPVSMALSEDTFVPPTPAFYSESSKMQRPKSFG